MQIADRGKQTKKAPSLPKIAGKEGAIHCLPVLLADGIAWTKNSGLTATLRCCIFHPHRSSEKLRLFVQFSKREILKKRYRLLRNTSVPFFVSMLIKDILRKGTGYFEIPRCLFFVSIPTYEYNKKKILSKKLPTFFLASPIRQNISRLESSWNSGVSSARITTLEVYPSKPGWGTLPQNVRRFFHLLNRHHFTSQQYYAGFKPYPNERIPRSNI